MPQYFFVEGSIGKKVFSCRTAQSTETATSQEGKWGTDVAVAQAAAFNTGQSEPEQLDITLRFAALFENQNNATVPNVEYKTTLMGCDTVDGTYVSQGATYTKNVEATSGTITSSSSPYEIANGGTITTQTYNFMLKTQFWYIQVVMTGSAYILTGITNKIDIYGFVTMKSNGVVRRKYKTKTMMHGHGLQVMSGPKSYVRFGRNQNLIFGDLNIEGTDEGGGGGYFQKNLTVGANETVTTHPLYVSGSIAATGNVIAYVSSDERLKTQIHPLENSLEKVKNLNPVDFAWKSRDTGWGTESPADMGLLAQDVEKQFPTIVKTMGDGYKGIRYDRLIPVLVDCVKTQDSKIEELKELVEQLTKKIEEE